MSAHPCPWVAGTEECDARANLERIQDALAYHATAADDPCQDRGVEWPCDVARAIWDHDDVALG